MEWHQLILFLSTAIGIPVLLLWLCGERATYERRRPLLGVFDDLSERLQFHADESPASTEYVAVPSKSPGRQRSAGLQSREAWEHRLDDQLDTLDRLIEEADDEIARLERALGASSQSIPPLTPREEQLCYDLHESGLAPWAIARMLKADPAAVEAFLDQWNDVPPRRAA